MTIIREVTFCAFCDAFRDMDRNENFSYNGKRALYDWLEDYSEATGEPVTLDVIALCCKFTEYADEPELVEAYDAENMQWIKDRTTVIPVTPCGYIVQDF